VLTVEGAFVGPMDWSPDGKSIAAYMNRLADRVLQFGLIGVADGSFRVLKTVEWGGGAIRGLFSPDGRDIAYEARVTEDSGKRDIYFMAADGSREVALVKNPGDDFVLGWTADGKHLLFGTDRNGDIGLWAQAVADRKPQGPPTLIKANIGNDVRLAGLTKSGALHLGIRTRSSTVEVASIDLATGKSVGAPTRPVRTVAEAHQFPDWSRDGKFLTYQSLRRGESLLGIRSMETGAEREINLGSALDRVASWMSSAPDGSYVTYGRDFRGRYGVFRIDPIDGRVAPIVFRGPAGRAGVEGFFWSPDGAKMYYRAATAGLGGIVERDVASGAERTVVDGQYRAMTLSPDGSWFTVTRMDMEAAKRGEIGTSAVMLVPVAGGEPRELFRGVVLSPQWTPDAKSILVSKSINETVTELWFVPIDGSAPRKFEFTVSGPFRLSPDGRQIAYGVGDDKAEVWVVENFMSALKSR
jgi:Tol biopolymer transport system component